MAPRKSEFAAKLKHRIFVHYGTTIIGCMGVGLDAIGMQLQQNPELINYGKAVVGFSGLLTGVALALAKGKSN